MLFDSVCAGEAHFYQMLFYKTIYNSLQTQEGPSSLFASLCGSFATDGTKCPKQNPVPDPGLGSRLPQRTQIQGGPRHVSDHESGRWVDTRCILNLALYLLTIPAMQIHEAHPCTTRGLCVSYINNNWNNI